MDSFGPNEEMVAGITNAFENGGPLTGAYQNFYQHELLESSLIDQGANYEAAHAAALAEYSVSPFSLYAPEVIDAKPALFNNVYRLLVFGQ